MSQGEAILRGNNLDIPHLNPLVIHGSRIINLAITSNDLLSTVVYLDLSYFDQ
jgi:hypothetical protein